MPGKNCSVVGCGTCRRENGVGIFKLPAGSDDFNKAWRAKILSKITKDRVIDAAFKERIENDKVYICEKHFEKDEIEICKYIVYNKLNLNNQYSIFNGI